MGSSTAERGQTSEARVPTAQGRVGSTARFQPAATLTVSHPHRTCWRGIARGGEYSGGLPLLGQTARRLVGRWPAPDASVDVCKCIRAHITPVPAQVRRFPESEGGLEVGRGSRSTGSSRSRRFCSSTRARRAADQSLIKSRKGWCPAMVVSMRSLSRAQIDCL